VQRATQSRCPQDFGGKELQTEKAFLAAFGQSNRDQGVKKSDSSVVQAAVLLNGKFIRDRVRADKGRLKVLLEAEPRKSDSEIVEELTLGAFGRLPTPEETRLGCERLKESRQGGAEDLVWSLLNSPEFLFHR
jgi:hypothetical protein